MERYFDRPDFGKLIIRFVLGLIFAWYGVKMLGGGRSALIIYGQPLVIFGHSIPFGIWIMILSVDYLIAGILFMAGCFFKSCCTALAIAEIILVRQTIFGNPHEVDLMLLHVILAAVCVGFLFIHPGRYSAS